MEQAGAASSEEPTHTYVIPSKKIDDPMTLEKFKKSDAHKDLLGFIAMLAASVKNSRMSETPLPSSLEPLYNYLATLDQWIDEIPPVQQPMRFGNKAYRTWQDRVIKESDSMLAGIVTKSEAVAEVKSYLLESFGSYERIDYGTGHELNFVVTLLCLFKLGIYKQEDLKALVNKVFNRYLTLMRRIQLIYVLEPAGSHGVWGLDDYQLLAFLFGASQLVDNDSGYTPDIISSEKILGSEKEEYMYFGCIAFIKQVKKGVPFFESSPILNDISAVPNWGKVTQGLMKMFEAEVVGKLPVIKHLKFGSILNFDGK
ncbi:hypothetical protein FGO68_gene11535 [Halteria grandinella]|uniref:Serine/threonine-protein phosphatase 2A activator n=1 Tax=Halteria grandinella TaxID=5974 RepID=A0A8J8NK99_HALGN|nr:hypothetical protein FGO68_gene11535 [Halteria grandinella]